MNDIEHTINLPSFRKKRKKNMRIGERVEGPCASTAATAAKLVPVVTGRPIVEITVKNLPVPVWGFGPRDYETQPAARMMDIIQRFGLGSETLVISDPFSNRLSRWITDNSQFRSYNSYIWINDEVEMIEGTTQERLLLDMRPRPAIAELERGVYYFNWWEEFLDRVSKGTWILFDVQALHEKMEDMPLFIEKFILRFSEKLRLIKHNAPTNKKAFDSIFLPPGVLTDIREDIDFFLKSRDMYKNELEVAWKRGYMFVGPPGNGKCLGKDTPVLMFDGSTKKVQDVEEGDLLMGDDSTHRKVLQKSAGTGPLYRVVPTKGFPYVVNENHVLSLKYSGGKGFVKGRIIDISVGEYLKLSNTQKHHLKGYRVPIDFQSHGRLLDPYALGYWLGNGSTRTCEITTIFPEVVDYYTFLAKSMGMLFKQKKSDPISYRITTGKIGAEKGNWGNCSRKNVFLRGLQDLEVINNKHVPMRYKTADRRSRLQILAGLLDSDGHLNRNSNQFEITLKIERLSEDVVFLAQSLGYHASIKRVKKSWKSFSKGKWYKGTGFYFRIIIVGDLDQIPTIVPKKKAGVRRQDKNVLVYGIKIERMGDGEYYGFELDGNKRFLLGDFTVTHNSMLIRKLGEYYGLHHFDIRKVIDNGGNINMDQAVEGGVDYLLFPEEQRPQICVLEDIDKFTAFQSGESEKDYGAISLHSLLKGIDGVDQYDGVILIATTNFPDVLHEAIAGRPGRFDKIYNIDLPTPENIQKLLEHYKIKITNGDIKEVVASLKGFSMAFVVEFVKSAKMKFMRNELTMEEARIVLKAIQDHKDLCRKHFKEIKDIGFKKG